MKQTAVQWLIESITLGLSEKGMKTAFNKALEMEKEQMMDAYHEDRPFLWGYETGEFFEQYYKENYEAQND
jgi:hypothetical protein